MSCLCFSARIIDYFVLTLLMTIYLPGTFGKVSSADRTDSANNSANNSRSGSRSHSRGGSRGASRSSTRRNTADTPFEWEEGEGDRRPNLLQQQVSSGSPQSHHHLRSLSSPGGDRRSSPGKTHYICSPLRVLTRHSLTRKNSRVFLLL
jgi:hypothetical protein